MYNESKCGCNKGVKCSVEECKFHEEGDYCAANVIKIDACCNNVECSDNTMCQSFEPKNR